MGLPEMLAVAALVGIGLQFGPKGVLIGLIVGFFVYLTIGAVVWMGKRVDKQDPRSPDWKRPGGGGGAAD